MLHQLLFFLALGLKTVSGLRAEHLGAILWSAARTAKAKNMKAKSATIALPTMVIAMALSDVMFVGRLCLCLCLFSAYLRSIYGWAIK